MVASRIQANYDCLLEIMKLFMRHADMTVALTFQIEGLVDQLQRGAWRGVGAEAFYAEMCDLILPAMSRLQDALQFAGEGTGKIQAILSEAEEEAARLFRGERASENPVLFRTILGGGQDKPKQAGGDPVRDALRQLLGDLDRLDGNFIPPDREGVYEESINNLSGEEAESLLNTLRNRNYGDLNGDGKIDIDDAWLAATGRTSREFPIDPDGEDNLTAHHQGSEERTSSFQYGITWLAEGLFNQRRNPTDSLTRGTGFGSNLLDEMLAMVGIPGLRTAIGEWGNQFLYDSGSAPNNAMTLGHFFASNNGFVQTTVTTLPITDGDFDFSGLRSGDVIFLMNETPNPQYGRHPYYTNAAVVVGYDIVSGEPIVALRKDKSNSVEYMKFSTLVNSSEKPILNVDVGRITDPRVTHWQAPQDTFPLDPR